MRCPHGRVGSTPTPGTDTPAPTVGGPAWKRYGYPRWQFTNHSADIRELCWALDLVGIPWRQSNRYVISVSTRAGVARLDEPIGLKS